MSERSKQEALWTVEKILKPEIDNDDYEELESELYQFCGLVLPKNPSEDELRICYVLLLMAYDGCSGDGWLYDCRAKDVLLEKAPRVVRWNEIPCPKCGEIPHLQTHEFRYCERCDHEY